MSDTFDPHEPMPGDAGDRVTTPGGRHAEMARLVAEMDRVAALSAVLLRVPDPEKPEFPHAHVELPRELT